MWNPDLASEAIHEEKLTFTGGGRLRPEGGLFEISLSVGQVGLELNLEGGRLFPASIFPVLRAEDRGMVVCPDRFWEDLQAELDLIE